MNDLVKDANYFREVALKYQEEEFEWVMKDIAGAARSGNLRIWIRWDILLKTHSKLQRLGFKTARQKIDGIPHTLIWWHKIGKDNQ